MYGRVGMYRGSETPESVRVQELRHYLQFLSEAVQNQREVKHQQQRVKETTTAQTTNVETESGEDFSPSLSTEDVEQSDASKTCTEESEISLRNVQSDVKQSEDPSAGDQTDETKGEETSEMENMTDEETEFTETASLAETMTEPETEFTETASLVETMTEPETGLMEKTSLVESMTELKTALSETTSGMDDASLTLIDTASISDGEAVPMGERCSMDVPSIQNLRMRLRSFPIDLSS